MKALSTRQPWAWAIIHAGKDIENRSWPTYYRGLVFIHAAKGMTRNEYEDFREFYEAVILPGDRSLPPHRRPERPDRVPTFDTLERGGIVGQARIVDCVSSSPSPWFFGTYGFALADPQPLPFRPMKGALGFFDPEHQAAVEANVRAMQRRLL